MSDAESVAQTELRILYQDDLLIAVEKPSGMFVHRSDADRTATEFVVQCVRDQVGAFVYPVHRLDRATSGVLMLARNSNAAARLCKLFAERNVAKTYLALVRGRAQAEGQIDTPLASARGRDKPEEHLRNETQAATTQFRTLERFEVPLPSRYPTTRCSLLEVHPLTGRYHQIRRHLNSLSHPVIGDSSHGDSHQNRFFREQLGVTRLMLAAVRLQFVHPVSGQLLTIECPADASFEDVICRLRSFPDAGADVA